MWLIGFWVFYIFLIRQTRIVFDAVVQFCICNKHHANRSWKPLRLELRDDVTTGCPPNITMSAFSTTVVSAFVEKWIFLGVGRSRGITAYMNTLLRTCLIRSRSCNYVANTLLVALTACFLATRVLCYSGAASGDAERWLQTWRGKDSCKNARGCSRLDSPFDCRLHLMGIVRVHVWRIAIFCLLLVV